VNLPAATTIAYAFYGCSRLTTVILPATPPFIDTLEVGEGRCNGIFYYTDFATNVGGAITVRVPVGTVSAYTSAWRVSANTPADGNTSVYGDYHKAVLITDVQ
jgi:hypothetical protein